ncbi:hypothetical protein ES703_89633 [subsurface metagenome]
MKTIITVTICIGLLAAGCTPYQSPLKPALQSLTEEKQLLELDTQILMSAHSKYNGSQKAHTEHLREFMASLNNEQREEFEKIHLQLQRGEITEITSAQRIEKVLLTKGKGDMLDRIAVLAEWNDLLNQHNQLVAESNEIRAKAQTLLNRALDLERRQKLVLQVGFAMIEAEQRYWQQQQQQQQQNQTYRYQQQQLYQLGEINRNLQDLWMQQQNQQHKIQIIPAPRPVPLYWQ